MTRRVPVKLRPDVYCCKIVDINKVGRKVVKVTRLRKEDMIRYEKVKKERPPPSQEVEEVVLVPSSSVAVEAEFEFKDVNSGNCSVMEEVCINAVDTDKNNLDVVVKSESAEQEMPFHFEYEETVSSNSSLVLALTDSEDDDDYDDAHENDIVCNLVEGVQPPKKHLVPRRVVLSKSRPRREIIKFGFSKFEIKNSTQNLDRFFVPKPRLKVRFKPHRKPSKTHGREAGVEDSVEKDLIEAKHKPKVICEDPSEEILVDIEDLSVDSKKLEEFSVQEESVQLLSDEHPFAENEFVNATFVNELNEVLTAGNLVIVEEQQDVGDTLNEELYNDALEVTEFGTSVGFIEDPLGDEIGKVYVEEGTVSVPELVQVLTDTKEETDDVQTESNCGYEVNKASEDKIGDEAELEESHKKDEDLGKIAQYSISFYKNEPKPDDGLGMPEPPIEKDMLASTEVGLESTIVLPETASFTGTEVCEAVSVQDCNIILLVSESSTECTIDRTATNTREEVDNLQPCLAVWTLTARQAREESFLNSSLEISQVQPTTPQCGEIVVDVDVAHLDPRPLFGAALESSSKAPPEDLKLDLNLSFPIRELATSSSLETTSPPPLGTTSPPSLETTSPPPLETTSPPPLAPTSPPLETTSLPPKENISELLTPSCVQLQSYLSDAIVSDVDLEVLASLDTSPDVIITEVPHVARDMENNVIDKVKLENAKSSDDSDTDSDVVLLSDDETELCSPTPSLTIISSWQVDILSQTWQAWPLPTQATLLHLGLETGLSDGTIRDWFKKRTDQELVRVWGELENM